MNLSQTITIRQVHLIHRLIELLFIILFIKKIVFHDNIYIDKFEWQCLITRQYKGFNLTSFLALPTFFSIFCFLRWLKIHFHLFIIQILYCLCRRLCILISMSPVKCLIDETQYNPNKIKLKPKPFLILK